jgi:hypothetical protein
MLDFATSLSLSSGAALVALVSAVMALGLTRVRAPLLQLGLALVPPFGVAWVLYWLPVWMGNDPSEYSAWAPLFIVPWYGAGAVASLLIVAIDIVRKGRREQRRSR